MFIAFRFDLYPLDSHICKFRVGSTNLNMERMLFAPTGITYDEAKRNTILDYSVDLGNIHEKDRLANVIQFPLKKPF